MAGKKILIADDEARLRKLLSDYLVREGYEVLEAADGEEALDIFYRENELDLLILDVMMPGVDGFQVCQEVRETSDIPKPFSPKVLVARVNAIIRRTCDAKQSNKETIEAGGIVVDKRAHIVTIDGEEVVLSVKEFELLTYFMQNANIALSRDKILNGVWNYDYFGDARTIDTHVKKLRAKLGDKGQYIKTIWGMGYKFEVGE